jgi:hypothetical protein
MGQQEQAGSMALRFEASEAGGRRRLLALLAVAAVVLADVGPAAGAAHAADPEPAPTPYTLAFLDGEDEWLMGDRVGTYRAPDAWVFPTLQLPFDPGQGWINVSGAPVGGAPGESISIRFAAPYGQALAVGEYPSATRLREADAPQLDVDANGSGCNASTGRFEIFELERDVEGQITRLALDFEHVCEVTPARMFGSIRLNATTPVAALSYAPRTVDFGPVDLGTAGPPVEVTLQNTGTLPQSVVPRLAGADADQFEITGSTCAAELAPEATCIVSIRFAPDRYDTREADLIIDDSTPRGWREIDLTGMGLAPTTTTLEVADASGFPGGTTIRATVSPVPRSGDVVIYDGADQIGVLAVPTPDAGTVTMWAALPAGTHQLRAEYLGEAPYQGSTSEAKVHVASLASRTTLEASTVTAGPGADVRLFASVDVAGRQKATAGTLTIRDLTSNVTLASLIVTPGMAELRAVAPDAAGHTLAAEYSGSGAVSGSSAQVAIAPVDTTDPEASIQLGSGATWCTSDWLMLRVIATDSEPSGGIDAVRYSEDGTTWEPWILWQPQITWTEMPFMERPWTFSGPDGPKQVWVQVRDAAGNMSEPAVDEILLDRAAPAPRAPTAGLTSGGTLDAGSVPVTVAYGTTDTYSGIGSYLLEARTSAGSWGIVKLPDDATTAIRKLRSGTSHAFRSAAEDIAGNWSTPAAGRSFSLSTLQDGSSSVRYGGSWVRRTPSWASGVSVRRTTAIGATARFAFTGSAVGVVAAMGSDAGRVAVYLDGTRVGTIDLYSPVSRHRRIVGVVTASAGQHVLKLVTVGPSEASSGRRVVLDAFVVMR